MTVINDGERIAYAVKNPLSVGFEIESGCTVFANEVILRIWPNMP